MMFSIYGKDCLRTDILCGFDIEIWYSDKVDKVHHNVEKSTFMNIKKLPNQVSFIVKKKLAIRRKITFIYI